MTAPRVSTGQPVAALVGAASASAPAGQASTATGDADFADLLGGVIADVPDKPPPPADGSGTPPRRRADPAALPADAAAALAAAAQQPMFAQPPPTGAAAAPAGAVAAPTGGVTAAGGAASGARVGAAAVAAGGYPATATTEAPDAPSAAVPSSAPLSSPPLSSPPLSSPPLSSSPGVRPQPITAASQPATADLARPLRAPAPETPPARPAPFADAAGAVPLIEAVSTGGTEQPERAEIQPVHRPSTTVDEHAAPSPPGAQLAAAPVALAAAVPVEEPAPPPTITEVQQPLVASLTRLRGQDGTHELTVQLHPAELGAVNVTATIREGALTVTLACADQGAHASVAAALPHLQHELHSAGFTGVDVSLGQRPADPDPNPNPNASDRRHEAGKPADPAAPQDPPPVERRRSRSAAGLDRWL